MATKLSVSTAVSGPAQRSQRRATLDEIRTWAAVVGVPKASTEAFGFSVAHGYNLVKIGQFPAKVIEAGGRKLVVTASIVAALSSEAA